MVTCYNFTSNIQVYFQTLLNVRAEMALHCQLSNNAVLRTRRDELGEVYGDLWVYLIISNMSSVLPRTCVTQLLIQGYDSDSHLSPITIFVCDTFLLLNQMDLDSLKLKKLEYH